MRRAVAAEKMGEDKQQEIYQSQALDDQDFIATLMPIRDEAQKQVEYMKELTDMLATRREQLAYKVESQESKYKALKAMSGGMRAASDVIGGAGGMSELWKETNNQLIGEMNNMTASIQVFEDKIRPAIEQNRFDQKLRKEEGMKLLEQFKNPQLQENN
jgi:hypothetical protein